MTGTPATPSGARGGRPTAPLGRRVGPYRLLVQVGEGGMGVVHLALDPEGRTVALKLLRPHVAGDPSARDRLRREVETLRRVRHRRVAEVLDADPDGPEPYVVTQFVPGRSLEQHVEDEGPLAPAALARLADGLGQALAAVHDAGVVHRDLKPANVLMLDGDPVVIDFGIAKVADDVRLTRADMVMGTPGYLAPELVEGAEVGPAADWWGWAATTAFAATGRPPFGRGPLEAVLGRVRRGEPDLDGVPAQLVPVLAAALSPDVARRPGEGWLRRAVEDLAATAGDVPPSAGDAAATSALAELAGGRLDADMTSAVAVRPRGPRPPRDPDAPYDLAADLDTGPGEVVDAGRGDGAGERDPWDDGDDDRGVVAPRPDAAATAAVPRDEVPTSAVPRGRADDLEGDLVLEDEDDAWDDEDAGAWDEDDLDPAREERTRAVPRDELPTSAVPVVEPAPATSAIEVVATSAMPVVPPPVPDDRDRLADDRDDLAGEHRADRYASPAADRYAVPDGRSAAPPDDRYPRDLRGASDADTAHADRDRPAWDDGRPAHAPAPVPSWYRSGDDVPPPSGHGPAAVGGPWGEPAPHGSAPVPAARRPDRPGLRAAVAAALVATTSLVPVVGVLLGLAVVLVSRTVERSSRWVTRRREGGLGPRRGDVPWAVLRSPLSLLAAAVPSVLSLVLPLVVAVATAYVTAFALSGAAVVTGDTVSLAAGAAAGAATTWWGPGGRRTRRGAVLLSRAAPRGAGGRVVVLVALLVVVAAVWLSVAGTMPDWRPLPAAPSLP